MKQIQLVLFGVFLSNVVIAQNIYSGKVINAHTQEPISFVNIGVIGKQVGTVSDSNGEFEISLGQSFDRDSIKISIIGYKGQTLITSEFKSKFRNGNSLILLEEEFVELDQIVINQNKLSTKTLGNKTESKMLSGGFGSQQLGSEVGIRIKIKESPTYLDKFNCFISNNRFDSVTFRLNIYQLTDGLPGENILKENILVRTKIKQGRITVDLTEYNIIVKNVFIISLEWLEMFGNVENGVIFFSAALLNSSVFLRETSQSEWERKKGIGVGFNVTTTY